VESVLLLTVVHPSSFPKDASSFNLFSPTKSVWKMSYILKAVKLAWLLQVWYTVVPELRYWNKKHILHSQKKLSFAVMHPQADFVQTVLASSSLFPQIYIKILYKLN